MSLLKKLTGQSADDKPAYEGREADYWDERFEARAGELRAPGHSGLDEAANRRDYDRKRAFFQRHMHRWAPPRIDGQPARLLDAGCGPATFTETWLELGYAVTGIDFSKAAIDAAEAAVGDQAEFLVNPLDTTPPGAPFDAVVCVDVLFHVVRDDAWHAAMRTFANCTRDGAPLIIQEMLDPTRRKSRHVRWRTRAEYTAALNPLGLTLEEHQLYRLEEENADKDLLVFRKNSTAEPVA